MKDESFKLTEADKDVKSNKFIGLLMQSYTNDSQIVMFFCSGKNTIKYPKLN